MQTHTATLRRLAAALFIIHFSLFIGRAHAQQVAQPPLATTGTTPTTTGTTVTPASGIPQSEIRNPQSDDEIVQLGVFNVNSSADRGYQAMNTASGSRINTPLRDTAASISVFTAEFLQDIGATTVEDMLSYGANVEGFGADDLTGGMNPDSMNPGTTDTNFRIRGMTANTAVDGVQTSFSQDLYNIDRSEISSGPNSILFGMGEPGGMVALSSKRANLQRNTLKVMNVIGTWTSPAVSGIPYYRATADYNVVLMPRVLAVRLLGVYQNGNKGANGSWRKYINSHDKRLNPVVTLKPFKDTTISVSYEMGRTRSNPYLTWNADDHITAWLDYGRPILTSFNGALLPGTGRISATAPSYTFTDNNKTLYNYQNALWSISGIPPGTNSQQARLPASLSSYYYNPVGPSGLRDQKFDSYQFVIEQRLGNFNLQFGYYHNKNNATLHGGASGYGLPLYGDPNKYISGPEYQGTTGAGTLLNDYPGGIYMEDNWQYRASTARNDVLRLNAEYSFNLQKFGRHRLIASLENTKAETFSLRATEIFADEQQVAISNAATPNNANNQVARRHYVTEGDFSTYYPGAWDTPIDPFPLNGHIYHTQYVSVANPTKIYQQGFLPDGVTPNYPYGPNVFRDGSSNALNHIKRRTNSASITLQSYWFNDHLITLLGGRLDDTTRKNELLTRVTDSNDPRILNHSMVLNEPYYSGYWNTKPTVRPYTYSAGVVWHPTDRFSLFLNHSTNRAYDTNNNVFLTPTGDPPPFEGHTKDYGVMYNIRSDGSLSLRLTSFETNQLNNIAATGNNQVGYTSTVLQNIYTALYNTGLISKAEFDAKPQAYSASFSDVFSRGYEAEVTGRFGKNFTMRFVLSYTARQRENTFKEIFAYFNARIPGWMNLVDPEKNASGADIPYAAGGVANPTLYDYLLDQLYGTNGFVNNFRDSISTVLLQQSGGMASRPIKFNLTGKYTFRDNWLKGAALGGSVRYSSYSLQPNPISLTTHWDEIQRDDHPSDVGMDPSIYYNYGNMIHAPGLLFYDVLASYRCKLFGGRTNMTLQLNIMNIFNQDIVVTARLSRNNAGVIYQRRVYLNEPRSIRLTATFDF